MSTPRHSAEEFDIFAESTNEQGNGPDMMQIERRGNGTNDTTSPDYSDFILPDLPEILMEESNTLPLDADQLQIPNTERRISESSRLPGTDPTIHQPESDIFAKSTDQQGPHPPNMMQNEGLLNEINSVASPDYSNLILPDLPEMMMGDDSIAPDHDAVQHANLERGASARTSSWGVDNMLYQPVETDLFTSLLSSHDPTTSFVPPLRSNGIFHEGHQLPMPFALPDLGRQTRALPASPSRGDKIAGSKRPSSSVPRADSSSKQMALVQELFEYAVTSSDVSPEERRRHWESMSVTVCTTFGLAQPPHPEDCTLFQMVHLYQQNLLPLWPMICETSLEDPAALHPVLFLVAVSSGAMYLDDDNNASVFGTMMHRCLQTSLITCFIENEIAEADTIWLAQARNTIQVVSLYFGQGQELVYAQRLGAALVSQSRHMGLFRRTGSEEDLGVVGRNPEEQFAAWVQAETRRRVAFGIYRADVFLSLLLNCPPNISADELEIPLPYPDSLWLSIGKRPVDESLAALERERMKRNETRFCDLIRILLDRQEVLVSMEARNYELLLFGLQEQVWKFSHDPDMFQRLTGHAWQEDTGAAGSLDAEINRVLNRSAAHSRDHLQLRHREMKDLVLDRRRLSLALDKWHQSFNASRFRPSFNKDRGRILSSLLLFHIYHLQLNASLDVLHHIADGLCDKRTIDDKRLRMAIGWAHNAQARNATYHASKIWSLLDNEAKMNPTKQPRYTLLSFMGLHHASVVLWTCFGARRASEPPPLSSFAASSDAWDGAGGHHHHDRFDEILMSIVFLYSRLKSMSWDAFAERVRRLSCYSFPRDRS